MNDVQAIELAAGIFDTAIHVDPATGAGVALNRGRPIDDFQLIFVRGDVQIIPRYDGYLRKQRAARLPAF